MTKLKLNESGVFITNSDKLYKLDQNETRALASCSFSRLKESRIAQTMGLLVRNLEYFNPSYGT